jgi:hypothetical protein
VATLNVRFGVGAMSGMGTTESASKTDAPQQLPLNVAMRNVLGISM